MTNNNFCKINGTHILLDGNNFNTWDGLFINIKLSKSATLEEKKQIEDYILKWAYLGIEEGYNKGNFMHYIDDENFDWNKLNDCMQVYVDMGNSDFIAIKILLEKLDIFPYIESIKLE